MKRCYHHTFTYTNIKKEGLKRGEGGIDGWMDGSWMGRGHKEGEWKGGQEGGESEKKTLTSK